MSTVIVFLHVLERVVFVYTNGTLDARSVYLLIGSISQEVGETRLAAECASLLNDPATRSSIWRLVEVILTVFDPSLVPAAELVWGKGKTCC